MAIKLLQEKIPKDLPPPPLWWGDIPLVAREQILCKLEILPLLIKKVKHPWCYGVMLSKTLCREKRLRYCFVIPFSLWQVIFILCTHSS